MDGAIGIEPTTFRLGTDVLPLELRPRCPLIRHIGGPRQGLRPLGRSVRLPPHAMAGAWRPRRRRDVDSGDFLRDRWGRRSSAGMASAPSASPTRRENRVPKRTWSVPYALTRNRAWPDRPPRCRSRGLQKGARRARDVGAASGVRFVDRRAPAEIQAAGEVRQRAAAVREHDLETRMPFQDTREDEPRHGDRRLSGPPDESPQRVIGLGDAECRRGWVMKTSDRALDGGKSGSKAEVKRQGPRAVSRPRRQNHADRSRAEFAAALAVARRDREPGEAQSPGHEPRCRLIENSRLVEADTCPVALTPGRRSSCRSRAAAYDVKARADSRGGVKWVAAAYRQDWARLPPAAIRNRAS